jgi:hypothetical protein
MEGKTKGRIMEGTLYSPVDSNLDFEVLRNRAAEIDEGSQILFLLWMIVDSL